LRTHRPIARLYMIRYVQKLSVTLQTTLLNW